MYKINRALFLELFFNKCSTITEFQRLADISYETARKFIRNQPIRLDVIDKVAKFLDVKIYDLVDWEADS